jgi:hypothetical protein
MSTNRLSEGMMDEEKYYIKGQVTPDTFMELFDGMLKQLLAHCRDNKEPSFFMVKVFDFLMHKTALIGAMASMGIEGEKDQTEFIGESVCEFGRRLYYEYAAVAEIFKKAREDGAL